MTSVDPSNVDIEYGYCHRGQSSSAVSGGDGQSVWLSDADGGSCCSQFYSAVESSDPENDGVLVSNTVSSAADCDLSVAGRESRGVEVKVQLEERRVERDCRICHLSLEGSNGESGAAIELGCSCKEDLAAVHKTCAEAWFKIKGNKTCEICNSIARNVCSASETGSTLQATTMNVVREQGPSSTENPSCINGHRLVNFLLAFAVFVFVISWLFHFNMPS